MLATADTLRAREASNRMSRAVPNIFGNSELDQCVSPLPVDNLGDPLEDELGPDPLRLCYPSHG